MNLPAFNGRCAIMVIKVKGRERLSVCNGHWAIWSGPLLQPLLEAAFDMLPPGHRFVDLAVAKLPMNLDLPRGDLQLIQERGERRRSTSGWIMQPLTHGYAVAPDYLSSFDGHQLYGDPNNGPLGAMLLVCDGQAVGSLMGVMT